MSKRKQSTFLGFRPIFIKRFLRGGVKSLPVLGNLLEEVTFGVLDDEAAQAESEKIHNKLDKILAGQGQQETDFAEILMALHIQTDLNETLRAKLKEIEESLRDTEDSPIPEYFEEAFEKILKENGQFHDEFFSYLENLREDHEKQNKVHEHQNLTLEQIKQAIERVEQKFGPIQKAKPERIHNLPYSSIGDLFKGRDKVLVKLQKRLAKGEQTAITQAQAIHGLGGIGKTRLAVEFGWYRIENDNAGCVLFVLADSLINLISNLADLARPNLLDLPEQNLKDQPAIVDAVLKRLCQMPDALVIFDNADDDHAIEKLHEILPQLAGCRVLITSRQSNWRGVKKLPIDKLAKGDAIAYLLEKTEDRSQRPDDEDLVGELADKLDGLPIALEQAAAYINYLRIDLKSYLDDFEKARKKVLEWHNEKLQDYPEPVLIAWQTTEDQLGLVEKSLLRLASFMAPEAIPVKLFDQQPEEIIKAIALYAKENSEDLQQEKLKELDVRGILAKLANFSMITLTKESFYVHRLVQDSVRLRIPDKEYKDWAEIALSIVRSFIPGDPPPHDFRSWDVWTIISPHVLAVTGYGNNINIPEPTGWLMNSLASYFYAKASFEVAEVLYQKALTIAENIYGLDHPNNAACLNNLAILYQAMNCLKQAEPLMKRVINIFEKVYGQNHPSVATSLNNLAVLYNMTNRHKQAEPLIKRALAINEAVLGKEHPEVAIPLNNLAELLKETGRFDEAESMYRRAMAIIEKSFGQEHPRFAIYLNNLALLLHETNRLDEAEPMYRKALSIREQSFGSDHPDVANSLWSLGVLYHETNRVNEAELLYKRALKIYTNSLGPDHPKTKAVRGNLESLKNNR